MYVWLWICLCFPPPPPLFSFPLYLIFTPFFPSFLLYIPTSLGIKSFMLDEVLCGQFLFSSLYEKTYMIYTYECQAIFNSIIKTEPIKKKVFNGFGKYDSHSFQWLILILCWSARITSKRKEMSFFFFFFFFCSLIRFDFKIITICTQCNACLHWQWKRD